MESLLIQFFILVQEFFSPVRFVLLVSMNKQISIFAQTLDMLRKNVEGLEITLFDGMVVSHVQELCSVFAQFEHFDRVFLCLPFSNFLLHKLLITRVSLTPLKVI